MDGGGKVDKGDRWSDAKMVAAAREAGKARAQLQEGKRLNQAAGWDILACDVLCTSSLVNAPMPLLEMAAREKEYSVLGFRPSTV